MYDKIILMTDLDGTFLDDEKRISELNMLAVDNLRKNGGIFTIATGRGYSMARSIAEEIKLDFPAVVYNGAAIYDFQKEEFLWKSCIDNRARVYVKRVMEQFPNVGIEVLQEKNIYIPQMNETEKWHLGLEKLECMECSLDEIPDGWIKVLFAAPPEEMDEIKNFIDAQNFNGVNLVRSSTVFYEMLPENTSKGHAFKKLLEITQTEKRLVAAVGDYYNDYEMVKMADIGFAVSNAVQELKDIAKVVVSDNNNNAIYEIVDYLGKNGII